MTSLHVITVAITLISIVLILGSLGIIVLKLISFVQNIFYFCVFLGQSLDQWFILEQMVLGYLKGILKG
jgi:hypothetical protein